MNYYEKCSVSINTFLLMGVPHRTQDLIEKKNVTSQFLNVKVALYSYTWKYGDI